MGDAEIMERVRKKKFLMDAFLHTCSHAGGQGPDSALKNDVTSHFLQAVIFELMVKTLYELDVKAEAPFTHDLTKLFGGLNSDTQNELINRFNEARERQKKQFDKMGIVDVAFHALEDILSNNEKTIKNFKYDAIGVRSNTSADGTFYHDMFTYMDNRVGEMSA